MLRLNDVLELPVFRRSLAEVIAGAEGLDRELRWAHVIEMADPSDLLKGGELVLTTGIGTGARERDQRRWIASVIEQGAAALAVELGSTWRERVPEPVVSACAEAGVPLIAFRRSVRFVEITEAVHDVALSAWADLHRAEDRGEVPEGALLVDVRLMDSSWRRLIALAVDEQLDDFDRVACERAALAVAIDLLGQQHEEHLRARSRGAFLSDLADGRVEEADARRRAEALGFPGGGRGLLLPVAASWRGPRSRRGDELSWTRLSGELRAALSSTGFGVLLGPRDVDLLVLLALGARSYDEALAEHVAGLFNGVLERRGAGPEEAALAIGAPADTWLAAGPGLRRVRRSACAATALPVRRWYDARRPGVADLLHDLREAPELDAFVDEQLGPLLAAGSARRRALLETLEAYLAAGGRKAQAARALHLERQSLYLRLHRIEELLGVSLEDEDAVLGLHLAVRALAFRRRRAAA